MSESVTTSTRISCKFRNLPIGYYFIYENKVFLKINNFNAHPLYNELESELFTNRSTHFLAVDTNFNYIRPSCSTISLQPEEMVEFIKFDDVMEESFKTFKNNRKEQKFADMKIGQYFWDKTTDTYYIKSGLSVATPLVMKQLGLDTNQNFTISFICSAAYTDVNSNAIFYNGKLLTELSLNAINIFTFPPLFNSFKYGTFDLERNWSADSVNMIDFLKSIPDGNYVILFSSNNVSYTYNMNKNDEAKHIERIFDEIPGSSDIFNSIGITENNIRTLGRCSTIAYVAEKNKKIHLSRIVRNERIPLHVKREFDDKNLIEYTYTKPVNDKDYTYGSNKEIQADKSFVIVDAYEIFAKFVFNLKDDNKRIYINQGIFDYS